MKGTLDTATETATESALYYQNMNAQLKKAQTDRDSLDSSKTSTLNERMLADDLVDNITTELNETQQHDSLVEKARQTVKNDPNYENEYRTAKSELQQDINQMNELQKQFNPTNK